MINRDSYKSLIESVNAAVTEKTEAPATPVNEVETDVEWDGIDEILAEGIEAYGEEGLAEILADFEKTGEISDELAALLGLE